MELFKQAEKLKEKTFSEVPLNEVDYTLFAALSYVDFDNILFKDSRKVSMREAGILYFDKHSKKDIKNNITGVYNGIKAFELMYKSKRYRDLDLYNYSYKSDYTKQFSALFIDIDAINTYISFEGTDDLISGWKEDFVMCYEFPVPAQREAIKYLNEKISMFSLRKYILGGHSKGGNLALVAGMYSNFLKKGKIKAIYSFDGPGLKTTEFDTAKYRNIESKFHLIIPAYSIVGLLLRQTDKYEVVKCTTKTPYAHSIATWVVDENNRFERTELSDFSIKVDDSISRWLSLYSYEERKKLTEDLFKVMDEAGISSLLDIKSSTIKSVYKILKHSKNIDDETKDKIKQLLAYLLEYVKIYFKEKFSFRKDKIQD